ncbi:MAG: hypothetical protein HY033_12480 [Ignavibacteriae bacterium]|nr:hypothetical protein [Ignavibacteria bacterium]MBI3365709.1 hypothetical protein [Ignavibacteriota bacterium]
MHKIIFDRSIFSGDKLDQIQCSELKKQALNGQIRVLFTPRFWEETLQIAIHDRNELKRQVEYLLTLEQRDWLRDPEEIHTIELSNHWNEIEYHLLSGKEIQFRLEGLDHFVHGDFSTTELSAVIAEVEENIQKRRNKRELILKIKQEMISDKTKFTAKLQPSKHRDFFNLYVENNTEWLIEKGIMPYHSNSKDFLSNWSANEQKCEFTKSWIRSWFAPIFLPQANPQLRIDVNDGTDAEQLAYMIWADAMVSDDTRFMREAFTLLYGRTDKKFLTLEEFLRFIASD